MATNPVVKSSGGPHPPDGVSPTHYIATTGFGRASGGLVRDVRHSGSLVSSIATANAAPTPPPVSSPSPAPNAPSGGDGPHRRNFLYTNGLTQGTQQSNLDTITNHNV